MNELKQAIIKEIEEDYNKDLEHIKTEDGFKLILGQCNKTYIGTIEKQKEKLIKYLFHKKEKRLNEELTQIKEVEKAKDFSGEFIITLEWKKSRMWGMNPRAYTNYGFVGESIGGCGYCKTSTATAQALNSNLSILKLMYLKKNELLKQGLNKDEIKNKIGYGCGYSIIPRFEGGVGVSSHENILKGLGLYMRCITNTDYTNVYLIRKMTKEELNNYKTRGY
jgi:hypothetical protein